MSSRAAAAEIDPMLQGTYLHDDAEDPVQTSEALDLFDARLKSGQPVHSGHSSKGNVVPSRGAPALKQHHNHNHIPHRQPLRNMSKNFDRATGNCVSSLTDEERERLEEIEAVRHLGNDSDGDGE